MMEGLRSWLLSGLTAGVVCAMAETLMPSGPVCTVGKLVCGMVLVCVLLTPLTGLDVAGGARWLEDYFADLEVQEVHLQQEADRELKAVIEERFGAYIVDKAAQVGFDCAVRITCREEAGTFLPHCAAAWGVPEEQRALLAGWLEQELAIPPERQRINEGESVP